MKWSPEVAIEIIHAYDTEELGKLSNAVDKFSSRQELVESQGAGKHTYEL